jgi:hypothetical protein
MKYIKTYENKSRFKIGDYVKCLQPTQTNTVKFGSIYKVLSVDFLYHKINIINEAEYESGFYEYRFILATSKEIEQYKIEQQAKKYNL